MNTGFLGPAVTTVLTVYGIETNISNHISLPLMLQQYLPFTVLKLRKCVLRYHRDQQVTTVLTVYGIET